MSMGTGKKEKIKSFMIIQLFIFQLFILKKTLQEQPLVWFKAEQRMGTLHALTVNEWVRWMSEWVGVWVGSSRSSSRKGLPVITWNKKHSLKQVAPITYTLEKKIFSRHYFWTLVSRLFSFRVKRIVVYFGKSSLHF